MSVADNNLVTGNAPAYTKRTMFSPTFNQAAIDVASSVFAAMWREAEHLCVDFTISFNAGSSAQVLTYTLPTVDGVQLTINSSVSSGRGNQHFSAVSLAGTCTWLDLSATGNRVLEPMIYTSTDIRFYHNAGYLDGTTLAVGDSVKALLKIPIKEWG